MCSEPSSPRSLKKKLKSTMCISGCFPKIHHSNHSNHSNLQDNQTINLASPHDKPNHVLQTTPPSPSPREKPKSPILARTLSKSQDKCRSLIHRIGGGGGGSSGHVNGHCGGKHIRRHTADFHYDAFSYALNFDSGGNDENLEDFPFRNFSARLPHSPPSAVTVASPSTARQIFSVSNH